MCGIAGFNWEDRRLVREMSDCLSHRGPDSYGYYTDRFVSLGHRRLAIIDLSPRGKNPLFNEDGDVCIVFNGEIYNYLEIKERLKNHKFSSKTDTEVIVHAYEEWGEKCLELFNGDFAFCIYDRKARKLFLARDRLGINPLYYYNEAGKFIFASEYKAILKAGVGRKINSKALNEFITFRFIPGEDTLIQSIKKLLPAHYLVYDLKTGKADVRRYWQVKVSIEDRNEDYFIHKIRALFRDAVEKRLMSDVPLGAYLSGGIDSSSVVAMMQRASKEPVKTFSVGFGYGEETDELRHAKLISDHFGTDHQEFIVKADLVRLLPEIIYHADDPMADPALIPVYLLSKHAKRKATVVLTGDGGDEVFAGYEQYRFLPKIWGMNPAIKKVLPAGLRLAPSPLLDKFFKYASSLGEEGLNRTVKVVRSRSKAGLYLEFVSIFDDDEKRQLYSPKMPSEFSFEKELNERYFKNDLDFLNQMMLMEMETVLPENYLMKANKMTLAWGVEERVPFLDHRLVELAYSLPPRLKVNGMNEKYILRKAMHQFVPKDVLARKKQRFYVPIDRWIKDELKPMVEQFLSRKNIERHGYFNHYYIEKLLQNYEKSRLYSARQLWNLLTFEIWHRIYIESLSPKEVME